MTDTDPEHKVGDVPTPTDRRVVAPNSDTIPNQIGEHGTENGCDTAGYGESHVPNFRSAHFDDFTYNTGDIVIRGVAEY